MIDHIVPKGEGGGDSLENLRLVCWECHWAPPPLAIPA
jgi:5-methylcytosine-specific restriction endonuclease McrA